MFLFRFFICYTVIKNEMPKGFENKENQFLKGTCMTFFCITTVPWNCCTLFDLSWSSDPCTHILNTDKIYSPFFLFLAVGKNGTNMGTKWRNWILKKYGILKIPTRGVMLILCHGVLKEQIQKLVRLLFYTTANCWRKDQAWVHFVPTRLSKV